MTECFINYAVGFSVEYMLIIFKKCLKNGFVSLNIN